MLLGGAVDFPEQAAGTDVGEPGVGSTVDFPHERHVQREAALGDRCPGDVVAPALDAQQEAVPRAKSTAAATSRADTGWRTSAGSLAAIAFQIDTRRPSHRPLREQGTAGARVEVIELFGRKPHPPAVQSCSGSAA